MRRRAAIAVAAGFIAGLPGAAPAVAATTRVIAVAIEFGSGHGLPVSLIECVHEPSGATDAQALSDALAAAHLQTVTFASSGLLCSIGGIPIAGCGTQTGSSYSYWAYFHGDAAGWHYANDGPAERSASPAEAEGWRYEDPGTGTPADPAPRTASSTTALCPTGLAIPPTTVASTTTPLPVTATGSSVTPTAPTRMGGAAGPTMARAPITAAVTPGAPARSEPPRRHALTAAPAAAALRTAPGSSPLVALASILAFVSVALVAAITWRRRRT